MREDGKSGLSFNAARLFPLQVWATKRGEAPQPYSMVGPHGKLPFSSAKAESYMGACRELPLLCCSSYRMRGCDAHTTLLRCTPP